MQLEKPKNAKTLCRFEEWHALAGAMVRVCRNGETIRTGVVDDVTSDGSVVWIAQQGVLGRTLVHKGEGYELWQTTDTMPGGRLGRASQHPDDSLDDGHLIAASNATLRLH